MALNIALACSCPGNGMEGFCKLRRALKGNGNRTYDPFTDIRSGVGNGAFAGGVNWADMVSRQS